jgi:hypothetical protein
MPGEKELHPEAKEGFVKGFSSFTRIAGQQFGSLPPSGERFKVDEGNITNFDARWDQGFNHNEIRLNYP